jgi:site-specific recombinase XerD
MPKIKNQRYHAGSGSATMNITFPFVVKPGRTTGTFMCHITCRKWVSEDNPEGRVRVSTGVQLETCHWDKKKGAINSACPKRGEIEMQLQEIVSRLRQRYEVRSEDAKKRRAPDHLTVEDVTEAVKGNGKAQPLSTLQLITGDLKQNSNRSSGSLFVRFMKDYRGESGRPLSDMPHHQKNFQTLGFNLLRFIDNEYKGECTLDFLDENLESFGTAWKHYLIHKRHFAEQSIHANMKRLKTLISYGMNQGYLTRQDLSVLDYSPSRNPFIALDSSQVWRLIRKEFPPEMQRLEKIRDLFVILCLTGLRYSDLHKVSNVDLNSQILLVPTSKQGVVARIPLFPELKKMLNKYPTGLDVPSNQKFNEYLKEVCVFAGLTEQVSEFKTKGKRQTTITGPLSDFVSSHTGRRTLVSCCRTEGIDNSIIMQITTHRTSRQIDEYTSITDRSLVSAFGGSYEDEKLTTEPLYSMTPAMEGK